ncbi:MAG: hypothetical protein PHP50_04415 [Lachnospiraceae bacterium]|nr:hypothetical protein [Lachnospiraceae bacterium]
MFFYDKKIIYLGLYQNREKVRSAGILRIEVRNDLITMQLQIKDAGNVNPSDCPVKMEGTEKDSRLGNIHIERGRAACCFRFPQNAIGEGKISYGKLVGIQIILSDNKVIWGYIGNGSKRSKEKEKTEKKEEKEETKEKDEKEETVTASIIENIETENISDIIEEIATDKWSQLKKEFPVVHPFTDQTEFISIAPKNFVILNQEYQELVNNSFLLHGFYNYHHIILGKYDDDYYLGVPGNYYERERMVASMFGFEGFAFGSGIGETENPSKGTFGYYMKQVDI